MKSQKMDGFIMHLSEVFLMTLKTNNSDWGLNWEVEKYVVLQNKCSVSVRGIMYYGIWQMQGIEEWIPVL